MAEPTDDQLRSARVIVERLFPLHEWLARPARDRVKSLPTGLSIIDLESHAARFQAVIAVLTFLEREFPALRLGRRIHRSRVPRSRVAPLVRSVPWALASRVHVLPNGIPGSLPRAPCDRPPTASRSALRNVGFRSSEPERGEQTFVERSAESLSHRVATAESTDREPPPPTTTLNIPPTDGAPPAEVTGCQFTVNTNTSGLRVFWSGAYYIVPSFFGAPTTPAFGTLQSGTYVFGVDGGAM